MTNYSFLTEGFFSGLAAIGKGFKQGATNAYTNNISRTALWFSDLLAIFINNDEKRFETMYKAYPTKNSFIAGLKKAKKIYYEKNDVSKILRINTMIRTLKLMRSNEEYKDWLKVKCQNINTVESGAFYLSLVFPGAYSMYKLYVNKQAGNTEKGMKVVIDRR